MNHVPAAQPYREQQAGSLQTGDHLLLPDGLRSAEVHSVEIENDDFGAPAIFCFGHPPMHSGRKSHAEHSGSSKKS